MVLALHLVFDLMYIAVDLLCQLVHLGQDTKARRAIKFFQTEPIDRLVKPKLDLKAPGEHGTPTSLTEQSKQRHNWDPDEIDFSADLRGWFEIGFLDRTILFAIFRMFFLGDWMASWLLEAIAANAPKPDEREYFGLVQKPEEHRHVHFFRIFLAKVFGIEGDDRQLKRKFWWRTLPSFKKAFTALAKAIAQLKNLPSREQWLMAVAIYHLVAEGILAARGVLVVAHILKGRESLMPGFLKGFKRVRQEEALHIAVGVMALQRRIYEDRESARIILITLARIAKAASGTNLPWLKKFRALQDDLRIRLKRMGITDEAANMVVELFGPFAPDVQPDTTTPEGDHHGAPRIAA